ncbi:MAG: hypothetical protein ACO2PN_09870 [Pyrobaculum sp.]|jgi:hypothetical protein
MRRLILVLALAAFVWAQVTVENVECTKIWEGNVYTNQGASVTFHFSAVGPVMGAGLSRFYAFLGDTPRVTVWDTPFYNVTRIYMAEYLTSGEWDRSLTYGVTVEYWKPEPWTLERYMCTARLRHGNWTWTEIRYYWLVNSTPPRETSTITFTVPTNAVLRSETRTLYVSLRPDKRGYSPLCTQLPTASTWPRCTPFGGENKVTRASSPQLWRALMINGKRPGDKVEIHGVEAVIPTPLYYTDSRYYGDYPIDTAAVSTDEAGSWSIYGMPPGGLSFESRIGIDVLAVPTRWGYVEARPPKPVPLYISRVVGAPRGVDPRLSVVPPERFIVGWGGNATWVGDRWVWNWTLSAVAHRSPFLLTPYVALALDPHLSLGDGGVALIGRTPVEVHMPLGSVAHLHAAVAWRLDTRGIWINSYPDTYLRAVDQEGRLLEEHYEEIGKKAKLRCCTQRSGRSITGIKWAGFAAAVDGNYRTVATAWYAPPDPCRQWPSQLLHCTYSQHVVTKVNGTWAGYSRIGKTGNQWPINRIPLVDWMTLKHHDPCQGFKDFMNIVVRDPVLRYWYVYHLRPWAYNPGTGDWDIETSCRTAVPHHVSMLGSVYRDPEYRYTTKADRTRLYHQTAQGGFYNYVFDVVEGDNRPPGFTDALPLGVASMVSNSTSPWAMYLVPTTACNSLICVDFRPALWGPAPGPAADLALPGAGYSFLLLYLGEPKDSTVRVYVEMGYVVSRGRGGVEYRWVRDYKLHEVAKRWDFLDAVYIGPGWHRNYTPLPPCQPLYVNAGRVYVTPANWTGPIQAVVEDDVGRHHFVFFVSNDVSYRIKTTTEAPPLFDTPRLDVSLFFYLGGVPYFHGVNAFGEGGRLTQFSCISASVRARSLLGEADYASQLSAAMDYWGEAELWARLNFMNSFAKPRIELVDPWRGLVRVRADGPVSGFAFYAQRNGTWVKIGEARGRCILVNASRLFPWDPVLVLPLVEQGLTARPGDTVTIWRPTTSLLFKTWADLVGYPKGARSELEVVRRC